MSEFLHVVQDKALVSFLPLLTLPGMNGEVFLSVFLEEFYVELLLILY